MAPDDRDLYILADGGTPRGRPVDSEPGTLATFSFLECFDYPFYSTLDVRFYGSMPLAALWPEIDKQVMRVFADAVPHDLGDPSEDSIVLPNKFSWQDTNGWKDLNSKFVLMVYRDFVTSGGSDLEFLRDCWPAVEAALEYQRRFDTNGDGLPESEGFPDQTYDVWVTEGESAYTGGLWLAALRAAEEMAGLLADPLLCPCGAQMRILSFLTEPPVVRKVLEHLESSGSEALRGPPRPELEPAGSTRGPSYPMRLDPRDPPADANTARPAGPDTRKPPRTGPGRDRPQRLLTPPCDIAALSSLERQQQKSSPTMALDPTTHRETALALGRRGTADRQASSRSSSSSSIRRPLVADRTLRLRPR